MCASRTEIMQLLLEAGADTEAKDKVDLQPWNEFKKELFFPVLFFLYALRVCSLMSE